MFVGTSLTARCRAARVATEARFTPSRVEARRDLFSTPLAEISVGFLSHAPILTNVRKKSAHFSDPSSPQLSADFSILRKDARGVWLYGAPRRPPPRSRKEARKRAIGERPCRAVWPSKRLKNRFGCHGRGERFKSLHGPSGREAAARQPAPSPQADGARGRRALALLAGWGAGSLTRGKGGRSSGGFLGERAVEKDRASRGLGGGQIGAWKAQYLIWVRAYFEHAGENTGVSREGVRRWIA